MARTQHLPLYSSAYVFTREVYRIRTKLPKSLKHDLGKEIFECSIRALKNVALANRSQDKAKYITDLLLELEVQWVLIRLMYDLKGITDGEFKLISERLSDIGKQAQAWLKWQQQESRRGAEKK